MKTAILEIHEGVATGPLHQPVPVIGRNSRFDEEAFEWPTLCGTRGYVYQRDALAALGHSTDCFHCAVVALTEKNRAAKKAKKRTCAECDNELPHDRSSRFCGKTCYFRSYRRENSDRVRSYHRAYMRVQRGTVEPQPRPCEHCGEAFTPSILAPRTGNVPRFCSELCRQRARRAA